MIALEVISHLCVLLVCSMALMYMERKVLARAQHRVGFKKLGFSQIIADSSKNFIKNTRDGLQKMNWSGRLNMFLLLINPILFYLVLHMGIQSHYLSSVGLLVLLMILMVSMVAENFFLYFQSAGVEKFRFRKDQFLNFAGVSVFLICMLVPVIKAGGSGLLQIHESQSFLPFVNSISSPGIFISAIVSFLSLFYICEIHPVSVPEKKYKGEGFVYLLLCSKRIWLISLVGFWLFLFMGVGAWGILIAPVYLLTTILTVFLIFWLEIATPAFRVPYSIEIVISKLLPLALLSVVCEIAWRALIIGGN